MRSWTIWYQSRWHYTTPNDFALWWQAFWSLLPFDRAPRTRSDDSEIAPASSWIRYSPRRPMFGLSKGNRHQR
jgi:hypothetical protein